MFNALADGAPCGALTYIKGVVDGEVVYDYHNIVTWLRKLVQILRKRITLTCKKDYPSDSKNVNKYAYKYRRKGMFMSYICVIFDEFADFIQRAEKAANNLRDNGFNYQL